MHEHLWSNGARYTLSGCMTFTLFTWSDIPGPGDCSGIEMCNCCLQESHHRAYTCYSAPDSSVRSHHPPLPSSCGLSCLSSSYLSALLSSSWLPAFGEPAVASSMYVLWSGKVWTLELLVHLRCFRCRRNSQATRATATRTSNAAPTPMPAAAPLESPDDAGDGDGEAVATGVVSADVLEAAVEDSGTIVVEELLEIAVLVAVHPSAGTENTTCNSSVAGAVNVSFVGCEQVAWSDSSVPQQRHSPLARSYTASGRF